VPKTLQLAGRHVPLVVKRHPQARYITLRFDGASGGIRLVLPKGVPLAEGIAFANAKSNWVLDYLDSLPPRVPFEHGAELPILGKDHRIHHAPWARRGVWRADSVLWVSGKEEHISRRVGDYLKAEARKELSRRARDKAAQIGRQVRKVSVRDTRSRWGSCSEHGDLNFSWRLILAPEHVLDYVVAHEVAHLEELNHGRRFWRLTEKLATEIEPAKAWLQDQGESLLRFG